MHKEGVEMKFADHLSTKQIKQLENIKSPERMSRKDIEELMGTKRDTYVRRNGAVRRK